MAKGFIPAKLRSQYSKSRTNKASEKCRAQPLQSKEAFRVHGSNLSTCLGKIFIGEFKNALAKQEFLNWPLLNVFGNTTGHIFREFHWHSVSDHLL